MAITASEALAKLFPLIEQVNNDHVPVEKALGEAAYLLRTPANAAHLLASFAQYMAGTVAERALEE